MDKDQVLEYIQEHKLFSCGRPVDVNKSIRDNDTYNITEDAAYCYIENDRTKYRLVFVKLDLDTDALYKVRLNRKFRK